MYYVGKKEDGYLIFNEFIGTKEEIINRQLCKGTTTDGEFTPDEPFEPLPHVVTEQPPMQYGVCTKTLNDEGALIDLPPADLERARVAYQNEELEGRYQEIDWETQAVIAAGFEYDGQRFSLSQNAQLNWQGLLLLSQAELFGDFQEISTKNHGTYRLTQAKLLPFIEAGKTQLMAALAAGRQKKAVLGG